jgi:hypothetical protein
MTSGGSLSEKEIPLLPVEPVPEDPYDLILALRCPFRELYVTEDDDEEEKVEKNAAVRSFLEIFRTAMHAPEDQSEEEADFIKSLRLRVSTFIMAYRDTDEIPLSQFQSFCLTALLDFFQNHLFLDVALFYSCDKTQIFCKLRADDDNLKAHADLIDYKL